MIELDPSLALQGALVAVIAADPTLAALGLGGRVRDSVEPETLFPFIKVGEDLVSPLDSDCGSETLILSTVRAYTRTPGRVQAKRFAERLRFLLTKEAGFAVPGYRMTVGYCDSYAIREHADGRTHHAEINFTYRLEPREKIAVAGGVIAAMLGAAAGRVRIAARSAGAIAPGASGAGRARIKGAVSAAALAVSTIAAGSVFSPDMLFAAAETGAVYDPSDLTSLYQTRTGGANVTAGGQPAAIMLDKSRMGGKSAAQFIADQPTIAHTSASASPDGSGVYTLAASQSVRFSFPLASLTNGRWYEIEIEVLTRSGTTSSDLCDTTSASITTTGTIKYLARRDTYDSTFRFVDVLTGAASAMTFRSPILREIPGCHAIAPSDAARPLYGREPVTGRRNLLLQTENLTGSPWNLTGLSGVFSEASGTVLTATAGGTQHRLNQNFTIPAAGPQSYTVEVTPGTHYWMQLYNGANVVYLATFDLSAGTVFNAGANTTATILPLGGGRFRLRVTFTPGSTITSPVWIALSPPNSAIYGATWSAVGNETVTVHSVQVELGDPTAYQKVTTALDVTEAGVTSRHFLQPDGVDDRFDVLPTCAPGEVWAHVGGWRRDSGSRLFALSSSAFSPVFEDINGAEAYNESGLGASLATTPTANPHVLTVERQSAGAISGRANGADGFGFDPHPASVGAGLGLFTAVTGVFVSGLSGRFYGGAWINRPLTLTERAALERWQSIRTLAA